MLKPKQLITYERLLQMTITEVRQRLGIPQRGLTKYLRLAKSLPESNDRMSLVDADHARPYCASVKQSGPKDKVDAERAA